MTATPINEPISVEIRSDFGLGSRGPSTHSVPLAANYANLAFLSELNGPVLLCHVLSIGARLSDVGGQCAVMFTIGCVKACL